MKFKGKMASWWHVATLFFNVFGIGAAIYYNSYFLYIPAVVLIDLYLIPVYFCNDVTIDKDIVTVHFGLTKKRILVKDIVSVQPSDSKSSAHCASFDRLTIKSKNGNSVYISVEDKQGFIKELVHVNKKIRHFI